MVRTMSDGEWSIWQEMQADAAPDVRVIWNKTPKARKPHLCDLCNEEIAVGEVYSSMGVITDGVFEATKMHRWAGGYPSGCPTRGARDRAEAEAQFAADQEAFFPAALPGGSDAKDK